MRFPTFFPHEFQKIIDKQLVYSSNEILKISTIGEKINVDLHKIKASYSQFLSEKHLFAAESIHVEVLKPAEETDAHHEKWKFMDIKKIKIKKLKTKINQVFLLI